MKKSQDVNNSTLEDLQVRLHDLLRKRFDLRMQRRHTESGSGGIGTALKSVQREIAAIKTIIAQKMVV